MVPPEQKQVLDLGFRIFALNGKVPPKGFHWKEEAAVQEVRSAVYGIVCDQVAVADTDTRDKAVWWWENRTRTPWMVKTPRGGVHFYYLGSPDLPNGQFNDWDLRAGGKGYVVGPGSIRDNVRYELIGAITLDLPAFDREWIPKRNGGRREPLDDLDNDVLKRISRARAYVGKCEPAVSGDGGHNKTMYVVGCLTQKFGLTADQAWPLLLEYNERCQPPWSTRELLHKLESALKGG